MHETPIYVRFCETDLLGHTNNTSYFFYFEESRVKFLNSVAPSKDIDVQFVVARITCDYMQQSYAGDELIARTSVSNVGSKSFTLRQEVVTQGGDVIAAGDCVIVCFNPTTQRSAAIPETLRNELEQHLIHS